MSDVNNPRENGFEYFFFAGQKRYLCNRTWEGGAKCKYDTYDMEEIVRHASGPHTRSGRPVPKQRQEVSPILDSEGRQIVRPHVERELPPDHDEAFFRKG